jgi:hypothetical protein
MSKKSEFIFDYEGVVLWGISTTMEGFQLCIEINRLFRSEMRRLPDMNIEDGAFKRYGSVDQENMIYKYLVKNNAPPHCFMTELKQFDFLFYLEADSESYPFEDFNATFKQLPHCFCSLLNVDRLKQKKQLDYLHNNE